MPLNALQSLLNIKQPGLEVADLRGQRESELMEHAANGDARAGRLLSILKGEQAADPDTGVLAHQRVKGIEDAQHAGTVYDLPEQTHMREDRQRMDIEKSVAPVNARGKFDLEKEHITQEGQIEKQRVANEGAFGSKGNRMAGGTSPLASGLMERVAGGSNSVGTIARLRQMRQSGKVSTGPAMGRVQSFLQHVPLVPASREFADFKSESDSLLNNTIKAITGAQMSEPEAVRIRGMIPSENDKDEVWESKAQTLENMTRGLNVRIGLLQRGIPADVLDRIPVEDIENYASQLMGDM